METNTISAKETTPAIVITPAALQQHWQAHRRLTRRVIEAFPEKELFQFSVGGMRPFAELAMEMIGMAEFGVPGIATNDWTQTTGKEHQTGNNLPTTKDALLKRWDDITAIIDTWWPKIPAERFQETIVAFGQYEAPAYQTLFYFIDNEIHHRGQGYVYLRALGIEPPPFWDRR